MMALAAVQTVAPWCLLAVMLGIGMGLLRLLRGPTNADRVMALDLITLLAAGAIGLLALEHDEPDLLGVALVIALISFLAAVALSMYVEHQGRTGGPEDHADQSRNGDA